MFPMTVTFQITTAAELAALNAAISGGVQAAPSGADAPDTVAMASTSKPKKEAPKDTPKSEPAKTEDVPVISRADVSKMAVLLATKGKRDEVVAILAEFGATAVTGNTEKGTMGLADKDLAEAHAKLKAIVV